MRGLAQHLAGSLQREDGAVAVVMGILLVVLLGMVALAVDVGAIYQERRELQNGADAGALAIAEDCARDTIDCVEAIVEDVAVDYANDNADDQASHVENLELDPVNGEITVGLLSQDADKDEDDKVLYHWFAPALGIDASEVRATATARWGPAVATEAFPFGVCKELWDKHRPDEGTGLPSDVEPFDVRYKGTGKGADPVENDCLEPEDDDFKPGNRPGNFSWVDTEEGECTTQIDVSEGSQTAGGDTGVDVPKECGEDVDDMAKQIQTHKENHLDVNLDPADNDLPIKVLPIYSTVSGSGTHATYELVTLGAFEFSGLKTQRHHITANRERWHDQLCEGPGSNHLCIQGRFVREVSFGEIGMDADSDVLVIELVD